MTLTEIKYVVSLAHFKHFGEAAANCNVSQPTLSIAVKKLESALGIDLFERSQSSVCVAPLGEKISQQAQCVLDKASATTDIAKSGEHQLNSPLHIGTTFSIGLCLFPHFIPSLQSARDN
ncbi:MAG: LysR family transcriptional regulator [Porticoccaceae bacterium]|jgi:LysR family hydrogen peroxide-inducible transcriptional activator|nr:LysR family transcriptional regulator [Porticoccaceae bacterium]MBT5102995.1 LysR family transcriptional regulator [Porticoccaceae bacterium]MBT6693950.1 LysR family transcriptional regulator [Porticoccaceae bacterium]MBT6798767.1 LysR family transcriptional regulator [Porticoccaceae bacterium]MBT7167925.1 LysR family transcriptional regulator [Porticoccaceae bacterium]